MNDVIDRLARLTPAASPTDATAADLRRGHRALSRRRIKRAALGGAALTLVVGGAFGGIALTSDDKVTPITQAADNVRLVDYDGTQVPGYTVAKVPEGFVLQGSDQYVLAVARPDDTSSISDFQDKIVVMLEAPSSPTEGATDTTVNGQPATIVTNSEGTTTLKYAYRDLTVVIQVWESIDLTDKQLVEFAEGIDVTADAKPSHG
ncbi:hypothetical protein G5C66_05650 [Nocardioides sp. KC13]|uniref:Uncharacterized protein n=1 Tax=Nocardioides turkmenicus TaxID=2711220 RepID=A0A6M1QR29_9ACTN|nr:hypothetical protein [Nocardioides sp. KC13]NGN92223.1 hypothetical protein [Nocardioides sp. KC13]